MSRLGKTAIKKPKGTKVVLREKEVEIQGPKGTLVQFLMPGIVIQDGEEELSVSIAENGKVHKKFHGLYRALLNNMVIGVSTGFSKYLEMIGVGFRAEIQGKKLKLLVGYSNPVLVDIPDGIEIKLEKPTVIVVSGIDKQQVGQFAATVRSYRKPEPYKGKGIRYRGEYVRKKAGKGAKAK
ncbi:MAG: 50S ribosomal protein L6 [Chlamydiota bacterium]